MKVYFLTSALEVSSTNFYRWKIGCFMILWSSREKMSILQESTHFCEMLSLQYSALFIELRAVAECRKGHTARFGGCGACYLPCPPFLI